MMLRPDKDLNRVWAWMDTQLAEILNGDADEETIANTFSVLCEYSRVTKVGFPRYEHVSSTTVNMWAGYISFLSRHHQAGRNQLASAT